MKNKIAHIFPANSLQQGFIHHALTQENDDAYRVQVLYDYHHYLNTEKYVEAWKLCIRQYPILRTAFNWEEDLLQVVYRDGRLDYRVHDISSLTNQAQRDERILEIQREDRAIAFDLTRPTLLRLHIIKQAEDYYTVLKSEHHSISDGWSGPILLSSLHRYYQALLSGERIEVKEDTAYLRAQEYISSNKTKLSAYWSGVLAEVESANEINSLLSRPIDLGNYREIKEPKKSRLQVSDVDYAKLKELSQREGITINVIVQFVWHKLLQVYSGQNKSVVGTTVSGRDLPVEGIETSVGLYINTLPLVIDWENKESILSQLHHIQDRITELNTHSFADLAKLQRGGERLFHTLLIFENYPLPKEDAPGKDTKEAIDISIRGAAEKVDYPLSIAAFEDGDSLVIRLQYDGQHLDEERAQTHLRTMETILGYVRDNVNLPHNQITLLQPEEYQKVIYEWNQTDKDYPKDKTIHELFEEQAARTPDNIALVFEKEQLTYRELNEKSNQLARHIRSQYKERTGQEFMADTLIPLCLERSLEMIVGILGVLKAGGAYVPIDPEYPQERIDYILANTNAELILSQHHLGKNNEGNCRLPESKAMWIDLNEKLYRQYPEANLLKTNTVKDLAYIIHTSGTTGKPKGVMVEHTGLVNLVQDLRAKYNIEPSERFLLFANYVFDASFEQIFLPLLTGATLFVIDRNVIFDNTSFTDFIIENQITHLHATPSYLSSLDPAKLNTLKRVVFGGEYLAQKIFHRYNNLIPAVFNKYGPTETTVTSHISVNSFLLNNIQIQNVKTYVLDPDHVPVPIGVIGQLYIGGAGVTRGYLNNEVLTKELFINNPFATETDKKNGYTRLYKTGDLVRWLSDGTLEFIGRNDDQVKIRGYRIELGEIENALQKIPGIKQSCVLARERETAAGKSKYLVGYYVMEQETAGVTTSVILNQLQTVLPDYMVPSALVALESFPLTGNGKLDKKALPDPDFADKESYVAPTTKTEKALSKIWSEVLGVERVGIEDNFFRIGGDSILSIQVSSRIRQLGYACHVKDIFDHKVISRLSAYLDKNVERTAIQSEQGLLAGALGLLPIQQWFVDRVESGMLKIPHHWNHSFLIRVPEIREQKLSEMISDLVRYHDIFRVYYEVGANDWKQYYTKDVPVPKIMRLDVRGQYETTLMDKLTEWQSGFDLEKGPLYQVGYLHGYEDGSARIFVAIHHLIVDVVSWRIIIEDLKRLYEGKLLPPKGSSYRQWVEVIARYPEQHVAESRYWSEQLKGLPAYIAGELHKPSAGRVELSEQLTQQFLQEASGAYHTEINDLLLTALAYALSELNGQYVQGITLEGHGREPIDATIDHSHTVGWYTSMYPVRLALGTTIGESICRIKEGLRSIPNKGIGFGAFAVSKETEYGFSDLPPVIFNYLGRFGIEKEVNWQIAPEDSGASTSSLNQDRHVIAINGEVVAGKLVFSVVTKLGAFQTEKLSRSFEAHLKAVTNFCITHLSEAGSTYTPSDFSTVRLSQSLICDLQQSAKTLGTSISDIYPANSLQQGFIHHALTQENDDAYRVQLLFDYHHSLDTEKYVEAWKLCIRQYPILRTAFNWEEYPIQVIYRDGSLDYRTHDISMLPDQGLRDERIREIQREDRGQIFDLKCPTLLRLHIIKQAEDYYTILKSEHHSISDGWSGAILLSSLHRYYRALLSGERIEVKEDTAYLRAQEYISSNKTKLSAYWSGVLSEVESANEINSLLSRPIDLSNYRQLKEPKKSCLQVSDVDYAKLKKLSQREGITINVIVQFVWHKLLQVYSGQNKSIVGTTVSGRDLPVEGIETSVGLYINTLPLVIDWENKESILSQLHHIQERITELNTHSFADLAKLQREGERLFHSLLIFENYPLPKEDAPGKDTKEAIDISIRDVAEKVDYPLSIVAYEEGESLVITLQYDGQHLDEERAQTHIRTMETILGYVVENVNLPHHRISLLQPEEYQKIIYDWNKTDKEYPKDKTIQELFEEQVARTPDNIALVYEGKQLTYKELNEKSNQLARHIRDQYKQKTGEELRADTLIALCLDRSPEMVVGILGVLKAGGAYVPIDSEYPQERIDYILKDTGADLVLSQKHLTEVGKVQLPQEKLLLIDLSEVLYKKQDISNSLPVNASGDLAYVIYTSGTTGRPKGVMVEHKAISSLVFNDYIQVEPEDIFAFLSSPVFDASTFEIWTPLLRGNRLVIPPSLQGVISDSSAFESFISNGKITTLWLTKTLFESLYHTDRTLFKRLKTLIIGGEALDKSTVNQLIESENRPTYFINGYGPTESTTFTCTYDLTAAISVHNVPIGKPINNRSVYILDRTLNPIPVGVAGELYIGGAGLSRGYLNQEALTKERFIDNPFATGADKEKGYTRLYKTGDLVRWLNDGNLEYLGRNDDQVKIRGYRIELGEIEHALQQIPGIKHSCVLARVRKTASGNSKYLVGYYVAEPGSETILTSTIVNQLQTRLPEYMIPSTLVKLESFPLTINGKLDKRALPDPDFADKESYVAPVTETERLLSKIWSEVLGIERVGVEDNFFRIGGDSILAIQTSHRMSKALGVTVSIADIFKYRTISEILKQKGSFSNVIIPKVTGETAVLSFAQKRLWFIEEYEEGTNAYHIPLIFELEKTTDKEGIKYAIGQIVSRHEVLRSTIHSGQDQKGVQEVHAEPLKIEEVIIEEKDFEEAIGEDINRPFVLSKEYPIRVRLYTLTSAKQVSKEVLLINLHHIASDGWSIEIFQKEMQAYYEAYVSGNTSFRLPELEIQYKDYAAWQRSYLTGDLLSKQLSYWKQKLSGYENLALPTDYSRPGEVDYKGSSQVFILSKATSEKLRTLAKEKATTLHSVLLSSLSILLGKYSGSEDIITGSPIANRHHWQTEKLIGFFVNSQVNRVLLRQGQSFESLIEATHHDQVLSQSHQDLPFEKLIDELDVERDPSRHPIFQVMFGVQGFGKSEGEALGKKGNYLSAYEGSSGYEVSKFDVSIFFNDSQEELIGYVGYATSLFKEETITRLVGYYQSLIERLVQEPKRAYSDLSLVEAEEYQKLIYDWNKTDKEYPKDKTIQELFEEQAARTPDNIALVYEEQQLTYKELNEKSNQLARHIRSQYKDRTGQELSADTLIALFMERSLEMVVGILGVLKAGGAYVPIDPSYPQERIDYLLEDTGVALVLSQRVLVENSTIHLPDRALVCIDLTQEFYQTEDNSHLRVYSEPNNLAYVIYTSGTTGKPKGVMIEHSGLVNRLEWMQSEYPLSVNDVVLQKTPYVFDVSVWELLWANLYGGKIVMLKPGGHKDSEYLQQVIQINNITTLHFVPSMLDAHNGYLAQQKVTFPFSVRQIICSGEELLSHTVRQTYQNAGNPSLKVHNLYGPTEASIDVTFFETSSEGEVCIGRPIQNTQIYILDPRQNPVPIGVAGELYIGGAGLSRGYLNKKALTEERFILNPFAREEDKLKGYTRLYKTGDLVRWRPDGNITYIGRNDDQVKIRGYRIELGEIENSLQQVPGIRQSCVLARERETASGKSKYLVGYYVVDQGAKELTSSEIIKQLSTRLPEYMVPAALVALKSFPLTINGKLDKRALPDPDFVDKDSYVAPVTVTERALSKIWSEVLGIERVGVEDSFFRIGGDSILSIQVSTRIRKLGYNCQVKDILIHKTISKLSAYLDSNTERIEIQSEQGLLSGVVDLLPIQQRFAEQMESGMRAPHHWNQSFLIRVPEIGEEKLSWMIIELIKYHDMFRARYEIGPGGLKQYYTQDVSIPAIKRLDVNGQSQRLLMESLTEWQSGFDIEKGPLFQFGYLHGYDDGSARIYVAMHHLITDAISWRIIAEDLKCLYNGEELQPKGSSYRQWAACIQSYPKKYAGELDYWSAQLKGLPAYATTKLKPSTEDLVTLTEQLTQSLLYEAPGAYHTEINDLLLTSLAYSLRELNDQDVQGITLEGHGREPIDPAIDHSHTVGWYTSMYPVRLELGATIEESIHNIKEGLRSIPNKGLGFGSFATQKNTGYSFSDLPLISFNYLGQFSAARENDWQITSEGSGQSVSHLNEDPYWININGWVSEGVLTFSVTTRLGSVITEQLTKSFNAHLNNIIKHCCGQLRKEELCPASRLQFYFYKIYKDGLKHPAHGVIKRAMHNVDKEMLAKAMNTLVLRHESLRTTFTEQNGDLFQRIAPSNNFKSAVLFDDVSDQKDKQEKLNALINEMTTYSFDYEKEYSFRCKLIRHDKNSYILILVIDHIIRDGVATRIVEEELFKIYDAYCQGKPNPLEPLKLQFKDYVRITNQHYSGEKLAFHQAWVKKTFKDHPPSGIKLKSIYSSAKESGGQEDSTKLDGGRYVFLLPEDVLKGIQRISSEMEITMYNFLLACYCIFLNRIGDQNDFVIDSPITARNNEDFSGIVGWVGATLSLRIKVSDRLSFREFARSCNDHILESMDHIHFHHDAFNLGIPWNRMATQINVTSGPGEIIENFQPYHYDLEFTYFDFLCMVHEAKNGMIVRFAYKHSILDKSKITDIAGIFMEVIKIAIQDPDIKLKDWKGSVDQDTENKITSFEASICRHEKYWVNKFAEFNPVRHPYSNFSSSDKKQKGRKQISIRFDGNLVDFAKSKGNDRKLTDCILAGIVSYLARINSIGSVGIGFSDEAILRDQATELRGLFSEFVPLQVAAAHHLDFNSLLDVLGKELAAIRKGKTYLRDIFFRYPELNALGSYVKENSLFPVKVILRDDIRSIGSDSESSLTFIISSATGEVICDYDAAEYAAESVELMGKQIASFVREAIAFPDLPIGSLPLVTPAEKHQLVFEFNNTDKTYSQCKTIHQLFEEQAERTPDQIALVFEGRQLSYGDLHAKSNQLAHHIRNQYKQRTGETFTPDSLAALYLERSLEMVVAVLGVLKAGGAYVPIDPSYPQERVDYMLEDTAAKLILSQKTLIESSAVHLPESKLLYIDLNAKFYEAESTKNLPGHSHPNNLAYVIYTSGTTGKPKGVMIEHSSLVNVIEWMQSEYPLEVHDVVLQKTPYVFDVSVWELLWANLYGAKIVMAKPGGHRDSEYLHQLIERNKITTLHFVPGMLDAYNQYLTQQQLRIPLSVRQLFCGGEALAQHLVRQTYQNAENQSLKVHNRYGPTETAINVTFFETSAVGDVYIGRPIYNTQIYILDSGRNLLPIGVTGELYVGGRGVSRGYLNNKTLTEERFVSNPFAREEDELKGYTRLYKTGDMARWLPDGNIEYIGRNDDQVKIRGFRIELSEIEQTLQQITGIRQSCVLVRERKLKSRTSKYLVAYYTTEQGHERITESVLLSRLSAVLPDYMIPEAFVALESFPVTINGKLDKRALPEPSFIDRESYVAPVTEIEKALSEIWTDVLGIERIGVEDNFFRIGGDSILGIQLSERIRQRGYSCQVSDIFTHKTISRLSAYLGSHASSEDTQSEQGLLNEELDALSISDEQPGKEELYPTTHLQSFCYNMYKERRNVFRAHGMFLRTMDNLDREIFSKALHTLALRHETLRTLFTERNGELFQRISPPDAFKVTVLFDDLTAEKDKSAKLSQLLADMNSYSFDYEKEFSFLCKLIRWENNSYTVVMIMDHIINDVFATRIVEEELFSIYAAYSNGKPNPLEPIKLQFKDYVRYHLQHYSGKDLAFHQAWVRKTFKDIPVGLKLKSIYAPKKSETVGVSGEFTGSKKPGAGGYQFVLPEGTLREIQRISSAMEISFYTFMLTCYTIFLNQISGQDDFVIDSPTTTRSNKDFAKIVGWLGGTLSLRVGFNGNLNFKELAQLCNNYVMESMDHLHFHNYAFDLSVDWGEVATQLNVINEPETVADNFQPYHYNTQSIYFGLICVLREKRNGLVINLRYSHDIFDKALIPDVANVFMEVVRIAIQSPDVKLKNRNEVVVAGEDLLQDLPMKTK